jgi:hypothetical protein
MDTQQTELSGVVIGVNTKCLVFGEERQPETGKNDDPR